MHDLRSIRESPKNFDEDLQKRGLEPLSERILTLDEKHRALLTKQQALLAEKNQQAKDFAQAKKEKGDLIPFIENSQRLKNELTELEEAEKEAFNNLQNYLLTIPNRPSSASPLGKTEHDNIELRRWKDPTSFNFSPRHHYEVGENYIDFQQAAKISGSRFIFLKGVLAKLERALINFMIDTHTKEFGYEEISPPLLVHDHAMVGTGQLPKFKEDQFQTTSGHWLIPTAEVVLTNLVNNTILDADSLPLRYTGYTPCFRAEAGAAGRDTKGLIRLHQFGKVELVSITAPESSLNEYERMIKAAEAILQRLDLPYRVIDLCTGDLGFSAMRTADLEVWFPAQNTYREISSCSICGDFQARRMKARYRPSTNEKPQFVHTLNGSGLPIGRTIAAILENYQKKDGSVGLPKILKSYWGDDPYLIKPSL